MLQTMRDLAHSWVFKSLMMILVLSFGAWGVGDMFRSNAANKAVVKVGKMEISVQSLDMMFNQQLAEARKTHGNELTAAQARRAGLLDKTLSEMVQEILFDLEAARLGLNLSDRDILARYRAMPQLQDKDGKFDVKMWEQLIRRSGVAERFLIDSERKSTLRRALAETIIAGVKTPDMIRDHIYLARGQKRILDVLTLKNESMTNLPAVKDEDLKNFYEKNGAAFTAPEYRSITIAKLDATAATKDMNFSEDDLKAAYEEKKAEFTHAERRDLLQVVLQDEGKAKELAQALKNTPDFVKAAKAKGYTAVALNRVDEKSIFPELYTTIFSMVVGEVSDPIKSDMGWHVVQVKKIQEGGTDSFESVKETLRATLQRDKADDFITQTVNKLDEELAANNALEDIADSMKLRLVKIPAIDAKGLQPDAKEPAELSSKNELRDDILKTAFGLSAGETSSVLDDKKGGYFVVRTDDVKPSQIKPYDEVREQIKKAWIAENRAQIALTEAGKIAQEIRDGKKFSSFATRAGVDIRTSKPINGLGDLDKDIPATAFPRILEMRKGDVIVEKSDDRQYVFRLADLVDMDLAKPEASRTRLVDVLNQLMPYEILDQYANDLRRRFPVKVNETVLSSIRNRSE